MASVLNFSSFVIASLASVYMYVLSVSPAQMERKLGEEAYPRAGRLRVAAVVLMMIAFINFILCRNFPITRCLPGHFAWPVWISIMLAALLGIPALSLVIIGMQDAGNEAIAPRKENQLYDKGIYTHIRHPQAYEVLIWPAFAFGLNSPLLLVLSLPWLLLETIMVMAEEFDLVIRFGEEYLTYRENTGALIPKGWQNWRDNPNLANLIEKIKELFEKE
jgi:protein-S-isoprenylcysteine O-methyltransferase Ste14